MDNTIKSLLGETRGRLLSLLRPGPQSIADLGTGLGVTDNAVRMHIAALERDGLVTPAGLRRDTGGKPSRLYGLTKRAEELFPKAYSTVLNSLLHEIQAQEGRTRLVELLRAVGAKAGSGSVIAAEDVEGKLDAAAAALRALGGDVEVRKTPEGYMLCGNGCPLSAVVVEHDDGCQLVEALVARITGLPVREACDRTGLPRCAFKVAAS